ncbi:DNA polymerase I [Leptospira wolffii]|uniref:DNA polymerase I n=1 Tax=Leptospira wolffii TaxID=409998 RepID=UPI0010836E14|nr:DNA polymerase I [Leptospira wolffii]TGK58098.1 DNA polymerase I [Leptospira wolffii]TGK68777.1 DNA polymerase I [Leptospira wolffii]TGK76383.1 DNA polymerase I [Leptospira wolffii]TGL27129.1 DNA polymerase I [Leptospira wolffii]
MKKLLIIDGHAFAFRAYYAFAASNLKNSKTGQPSGAVFGFFRMLFKLLEDYTPTHVAMTFDPGGPLERGGLFSAYKANRKPMPEDLRPQLHEIMDTLKVLGFKILKMDGHEADDIIGTLTETYKSKAKEVLIFSGDKDLYQLLEKKNIKMLRGKKGVTEFVEIDSGWVKEELGIDVKQIPDYMGIVGDTSDNIPGVKGIGEKGASKLIQEYKNLEGVYKHLDDIKNPGMKTKLTEHKESAFLSRQLATIRRDLDVGISEEDLKVPDYTSDDSIRYLKSQGYNVLSRDLAKSVGKEPPTDEPEANDSKKPAAKKGIYKRVESIEELGKLARAWKKSPILAVDTETTSQYPFDAELLGISLCNQEGTGFYIPVTHSQGLFNDQLLPLDQVREILNPVLSEPSIPKVGQNIKYDMIVLENHGFQVENIVFDTMLASYALQPEGRRHNMDDLAMDYLNYKTIEYSDLVGTGRNKKNLWEVELEKVSEYASEDADVTLRLYNVFRKSLKQSGVESIFKDIDMPLLPVLTEMEKAGIAIDTSYFAELSKDFQREIKDSIRSIHRLAGKEFNISSTKELQKILFEDLGLRVVKKTQTGYSTDHEVLEELLGEHPIIEKLLDYRKYTKLLSTYVDTLPTMVSPKDSRIHTSYNMTIAATGRLSSTDPNLQNIPIREKEGRLIRKGFIAGVKDFEILSLDYSQIELRIMAHISKDAAMVDAYKKGIDIHKRTAAAIYGVSEDLVTHEMRDKAKVVNFSVIYGVTPYGLSRNLRISREEAKNFIDRYLAQYPGVQKYMDDTIAFCEKNGYVETLKGRRRPVPDIVSTHRQAKEAAKRVAINTPIQGTCADMIKIAMIHIHDEIKKKKWKSKLLLQVHDELVFEVHKSEKDEFMNRAKELMENAMPLDVPIKVEGKFGKNWDEAH